jgi:hypothetical protein
MMAPKLVLTPLGEVLSGKWCMLVDEYKVFLKPFRMVLLRQSTLESTRSEILHLVEVVT